MTAFSWNPICFTDVAELMSTQTAGHMITSLISLYTDFTAWTLFNFEISKLLRDLAVILIVNFKLLASHTIVYSLTTLQTIFFIALRTLKLTHFFVIYKCKTAVWCWTPLKVSASINSTLQSQFKISIESFITEYYSYFTLGKMFPIASYTIVHWTLKIYRSSRYISFNCLFQAL